MNIKTDIKPVIFLKANAVDSLKQINETHRPVIITKMESLRLYYRILKVMRI